MSHLLVVDDENAIREMLQQAIRREGYKCSVACDGEECLDILKKVNIDLVITDVNMSGISGIDLVGKIKEKYDSDVIVMTGYAENYKYEDIIEKGAADFVQKPLSIRELLVRVKRVVRERSLVAERNRAYQELKGAHTELQNSYLDTIKRLVAAAEYKDDETGNHITRVSRYSEFIAEKIGLSDNEVHWIKYAAPMHDIGKIGIPDRILLKPGKLNRQEFNIMKKHTVIGAAILSGSKAEVLVRGQEIAISHHEKWNGKGYPKGLSGENIPLSGRIAGLADVFDALTSKRPYKEPFPAEAAFEIIRKDREKHFDPDLTDVFLENSDEIMKIKERNLKLETGNWSANMSGNEFLHFTANMKLET